MLRKIYSQTLGPFFVVQGMQKIPLTAGAAIKTQLLIIITEYKNSIVFSLYVICLTV